MIRAVIFDTNILRSDFLLRSYHFKVLLGFCEKTDCKILIPAIVWEEIKSLYERELFLRLENLNKDTDELNKIIINSKPFTKKVIDVETLSKDYIGHLKKKLGPRLKEIGYKNDFLPELVKRSVKRIKPISSKGQEFRDAILWLSILDYIKNNNYEHEISFITNNVKDFAAINKTDLHPDLSKELIGFRPNLKLYNSISSFNKEIAIKIDFITTTWIEKNIDWDRIQNGAARAVEGIDPSFFYEYFYRNNINDDNLDYWNILSAIFYENVLDFYVFHKETEKDYRIEFRLEGKTEIEFVNDKNQYFEREVEFGTILYISVKDGKIVDYDDSYYVEETGLTF